MINPLFWKDKKVFITGHTGFKGSWLSMCLMSLGADIKGFSLAPHSDFSLYHESGLSQQMHSEFGDIRDYESLLSSIKAFNPDIVLHLAAQALVRQSYHNPRETYGTNVMGTLNVFEAIRAVGSVKVVINVTSDKCYENKEWFWGYRETDAMGGYDPYSSSKGCAELLTASYRQSYFHPEDYAQHGCALASVRAGNVIGGGDWSQDRLVPDILYAFQHSQAVMIRNPNAIRPWQHVLEPLSGYLMLAEKLYTNGPEYAEGWNFGPLSRNEICVGEIVKMLANSWGENANWNIDLSPQPHEAHFLKLDCSKAISQLGWYPKWSIYDVIPKIVNWHKAWMNGQEIFDYCLSEINDYIKQDVK
ncbi:MAG: CDP-glucose 4,6-dehydratase [Gammaproteobacteria bacterium]|nr:CDP-glucose 4,6-dehydratase [Gammaproteobacteria bacterium]